jgi:outer membrane protein TolC
LVSIFAVLALVAGPADGLEPSAPPPLRFRSVLEEAWARNPNLRAYEREARAVLDRADAAAAFPDPVVGFSIHDLPISSFSFRDDMMTMARAEVRQRFPWFGKRELERSATRKGAEVLASDEEAHALRLTDEVARAYAELWLVVRTREVVAQQAETLERLVRVARQSLAVGEGAQADVLLAESELSAISETLLRLEREEARARAALGAATGAGSPLTGEPEDLEDFDLPPLEELLAALDRHPELLALRHRKEALHLQARLARKEKVPDPEVGISYGVRAVHPNTISVGVSFPIPVFGAARADRLAAAAESEAQAIERRLQGRRDELEAELRAAWAEARTELERHRLYEEEILPRATRSASAAAAAYVAGRGSFLSVIERERYVLSLRERLLSTRAAAFDALVRLATTSGDRMRLLGGDA